MMNQNNNKYTNPEYDEALDFLYSFIDYERNTSWKYNTYNFDLSNVKKLLNALDNPHERGCFIHVAGTNGKGSVAAIIASSLTHSGYKTGLYTSPHLVTFRERIKIDGSLIPKDDVVEGVRRIKEAVKQIERLTFFEVWTALALDYFAHKSVDISVIEVGMGGRLDTTNVISPLVSIITSISMDHCGSLGDNIEEIAFEKAGIIKSGIPVVSAPQSDKIVNILENKAKEENTKLFLAGRDFKYCVNDSDMVYSGIWWRMEGVNVPLDGDVQYENTAVALGALEILSSVGYSVTPESARRGIENVNWPGRFQTVSANPEVVVDGACNISAMTAVRDYLSKRTNKGKIVAVVGMCADKDVVHVLEILDQTVSMFVFTQVENPRALGAFELAGNLSKKEKSIVEVDPIEALKKAVYIAGTEGLVIVTGSLYLVGDVLGHYNILED